MGDMNLLKQGMLMYLSKSNIQVWNSESATRPCYNSEIAQIYVPFLSGVYITTYQHYKFFLNKFLYYISTRSECVLKRGRNDEDP